LSYLTISNLIRVSKQPLALHERDERLFFYAEGFQGGMPEL
jgi:hypothetical protein